MSDANLTETERSVAEAMSSCGKRLDLSEIGATTAMSQDAGIDGIDVDEFVCALWRQYGEIVNEIPWQRFSDQRASFRGCGCLLFPGWLLWRLVVRKPGERVIPPPNGGDERITVRHIARVIDQGFWSEPEQV